ncbi:hypothetical protein QBC46DRAFT_368161 [Diplogelasinospora grovesii]|uniref:Nephrocystin 3-like N-terminal domain-containing protein n=1 Tax=Diplogelasinospora grovesii TaxID=303347 RepID=A0AAN6MVZ9_9PEZI|nr:hypothetical protein QBC46DRAFT_368161 [Diplogelasinospora grovesii]
MQRTGKSIIALTVAREYNGKKRLGASFFSRGASDLVSTWRFAAMIALRRHIADAAAFCHPLLGRGAFRYLLVIIVNALDECDNNDDISLLIRCLAAAVAIEHVDLRIFVISRPD